MWRAHREDGTCPPPVIGAPLALLGLLLWASPALAEVMLHAFCCPWWRLYQRQDWRVIDTCAGDGAAGSAAALAIGACRICVPAMRGAIG